MRKLLSFLLCIFLVLPIFFCSTAKADSARASFVCEQSTGFVFESKNETLKLPMASTTKIMTALVTLENADLTASVKIPACASGVEGSSMYIKTGDTYTVKDLLYGLMLTSGNDAAQALAYYVGGGNSDLFVQMMNERAKKLGLENTNFQNPSGLPDPNHYTTAKDLAKIACTALSNPTFEKICSTKSVKIKDKTYTNHNKLLSMYNGAIGVKTGFTKKAGRCLVGAARKNGVTVVCVTLNDGDDWNDHITAFENAFKRSENITLLEKESLKIPIFSPDGKQVCLTNKESVRAVVIDGKAPTQKIYAPRFVYSPKTAGDSVGSVEYILNGIPVAQTDLCVCTDLGYTPKLTFIQKLIRFIRNLF